MLKSLTGAIVAAAAFGGLALASAPASAMPMIDTTPAVVAQTTGSVVQEVRLVCGPYRCFRRPNYYRPVYGYGYRRPIFHRYYGYRRPYGWHRWHRW